MRTFGPLNAVAGDIVATWNRYVRSPDPPPYHGHEARGCIQDRSTSSFRGSQLAGPSCLGVFCACIAATTYCPVRALSTVSPDLRWRTSDPCISHGKPVFFSIRGTLVGPASLGGVTCASDLPRPPLRGKRVSLYHLPLPGFSRRPWKSPLPFLREFDFEDIRSPISPVSYVLSDV